MHISKKKEKQYVKYFFISLSNISAVTFQQPFSKQKNDKIENNNLTLIANLT